MEAHRTAKTYNMGTLYWQLNDAWPVTSWSSIDYYNKPKELQKRLKTLFAPVLLSLDRNDYQVFVTSDLLRNIQGVLTVSVMDFDDNKLFERQQKVELLPNENKKIEVEGLDACLNKVDPQTVYLKMTLTEGEQQLAERFCYLSTFFSFDL